MPVKTATKQVRFFTDIRVCPGPSQERPHEPTAGENRSSAATADKASALTPAFQDELVTSAHQTNAMNKEFSNTSGKMRLGRSVASVAAGALLGGAAVKTGLGATLHEYVGHGYLGGHLTNDYTDGTAPAFQVDGWENFQAMLDAEGSGATWDAFCDWISGKDVGQDGASGWAKIGGGEPNELGELMGPDGQSAWVSVAGSIPGLVINSLLVAGGMKLRNTSPAAAYGMMAFGGVMHLSSSMYPLSAARMSPEELLANGESGHDFANFSLRMSEITGLSPQAVAITTAGLWVGILPAVALGMYLHQKSSRNEIVPARIALGHWLSTAGEDEKARTTFDKLYAKYPRQETMKELARRALVLQFKLENKPEDATDLIRKLNLTREDLTQEQDKFNDYLIEKLPAKTLNKARKEVLAKWEKAGGNKKLKRAITAFQVGGMTTAGLAAIFGLLGRTIVTGLAPVAAALTYIFPFLQVGAAGFSTYETYRDWQSDDTRVPKSAKVISAIKTAVSYVTAILLLVGFFAPGMQVLVLPAVLVALANGLGLGLLKTRIIKRSFELHQATKPTEWNYMVARYKNYRASCKNGISFWTSSNSKEMKGWVKLQKRAAKLGMLSELQVKRLNKLGISLKPTGFTPPADSPSAGEPVESKNSPVQTRLATGVAA